MSTNATSDFIMAKRDQASVFDSLDVTVYLLPIHNGTSTQPESSSILRFALIERRGVYVGGKRVVRESYTYTHTEQKHEEQVFAWGGGRRGRGDVGLMRTHRERDRALKGLPSLTWT